MPKTIRNASLLFLLFALGGCSTARNNHILDSDPRFQCSTIIIIRPGEMGHANAAETIIEFDGAFLSGEKHVMEGERSFAVFVRPGRYTLFAHSANPYLPSDETHDMDWLSAKVTVELEPFEVVHYVLERAEREGQYEWSFRIVDE